MQRRASCQAYSTSKGLLTTNISSCNLIGLPTFQHKPQKPVESDHTLSFVIVQSWQGKGRGWCARLVSTVETIYVPVLCTYSSPLSYLMASFPCRRFLAVVEQAPGAIAVHCKGLPLYNQTNDRSHAYITAVCYCLRNSNNWSHTHLSDVCCIPSPLFSWPGKDRNTNFMLHHEALPIHSC